MSEPTQPTTPSTNPADAKAAPPETPPPAVRVDASPVESDAVVHAEVERAQQTLDNSRRIKVQLTKASDGVGEARTILEAMEADVRSHLDRIDALLAAADAAQAAQ